MGEGRPAKTKQNGRTDGRTEFKEHRPGSWECMEMWLIPLKEFLLPHKGVEIVGGSMFRDLRMLLVFNLTVNRFGGANPSPEKIWLTNLVQPRQGGGSIRKIHLVGSWIPCVVNGCHVFGGRNGWRDVE